MTVCRGAVIGAGTMGAGIAMCFAEAGIPVTLHDSSSEALDRALVRTREAEKKYIGSSLRS